MPFPCSWESNVRLLLGLVLCGVRSVSCGALDSLVTETSEQEGPLPGPIPAGPSLLPSPWVVRPLCAGAWALYLLLGGPCPQSLLQAGAGSQAA